MKTSDLRAIEGFWYLATPYSRYPAGLAVAFNHACSIAGGLLLLGVPVFSPIAHSHPVAAAAGIDPLFADFWEQANAPFVRMAHGMLVATMPGWRESYGIGAEIGTFRIAGKPVLYLHPEHLTASEEPDDGLDWSGRPIAAEPVR